MATLLKAHADVGGDVVSAGGTGTYDLHDTTGVTEVQAGSYALMDTAYAKLGLPFRQAVFVVGTVIAVRADHAVADVGHDQHYPFQHALSRALVEGAAWVAGHAVAQRLQSLHRSCVKTC